MKKLIHAPSLCTCMHMHMCVCWGMYFPHWGGDEEKEIATLVCNILTKMKWQSLTGSHYEYYKGTYLSVFSMSVETCHRCCWISIGEDDVSSKIGTSELSSILLSIILGAAQVSIPLKHERTKQKNIWLQTDLYLHLSCCHLPFWTSRLHFSVLSCVYSELNKVNKQNCALWCKVCLKKHLVQKKNLQVWQYILHSTLSSMSVTHSTENWT